MRWIEVSIASRNRHARRRAFTLLELILVVGLILLIGAMALPTFFEQRKAQEMPTSADQLRSLVSLIRANASFEGKRYRLRFPSPKEKTRNDSDSRQPIIEREDDPIHDPELFVRVNAPWAIGETLLGDVRCAEIRLGRPTIEILKDKRERAAQDVERALKLKNEIPEYDVDRPPVDFEPDGSTDWLTFLLTTAPKEVRIEELQISTEHPRVEVIVEGSTGLAWLQRPFYDEELDLFADKGWPAVLRKDFTDPRVLTERDVLELRDIQVGR